jgi:NO-binding membrane sensor protein with MHYT domain
MTVLKVVYDPGWVMLCSAIGGLGGFSAVSTCEQYRMSITKSKHKNHFMLCLTGFVVAFMVVWGPHFVSMASFILYEGDERIKIRHNIVTTVFSLLIAVLFETAGLYIAASDVCFNKSSTEILEMFIEQAKEKYTLSQLKGMGGYKIMSIVLSYKLDKIIIGGCVAGSGIVLTHYISMMGIEFKGSVDYNPGVVALSVLVSMFTLCLGYFLFFRVLSVFPSLDYLRVFCAVTCVMDGGVHYIALAAMKFTTSQDSADPQISDSVPAYWLAYWTLVCTLAVFVLISVAAISDLRSWLLRTSVQLHRAEVLIESIKKRHCGADGNSASINRDIQSYFLRSQLAFGKQSERTADVKANTMIAATPSLYYDAVTSDTVENSFDKQKPAIHTLPVVECAGNRAGVPGGGDLHSIPASAERKKPTNFEVTSARSSSTKITPYDIEQMRRVVDTPIYQSTSSSAAVSAAAVEESATTDLETFFVHNV